MSSSSSPSSSSHHTTRRLQNPQQCFFTLSRESDLYERYQKWGKRNFTITLLLFFLPHNRSDPTYKMIFITPATWNVLSFQFSPPLVFNLHWSEASLCLFSSFRLFCTIVFVIRADPCITAANSPHRLCSMPYNSMMMKEENERNKIENDSKRDFAPFFTVRFFLCAMAVKWVASHTATQTSEVSHGFYDEKPAVCSIAYHMHLTWYFPTTDIEQKQQQASKCRDDERHERAAVEDFSLQAKRRDERRDFFHFQPVLFYSLSSSSSRWSSTRSLHSGLTARNVVFRVATSEHCVERRCNNEVKFLLVFGSEHAEYLILTHSKIWYIWNLRCLSETRASCCCADHRSTFYIHFYLLNWSKRHLERREVRWDN